MKGRLPRTCHGCRRPMRVVGCKRIVTAEETRDTIWVCAKCEPLLLRVMAEEGWDIPTSPELDGVWQRSPDPITRAVQAASRAQRGEP